MSEFCIAYAAKYGVAPNSRDFPGLAYAAVSSLLITSKFQVLTSSILLKKMAYKTRLRGGNNWNYPQFSAPGGVAPPALTEVEMAYMKKIPFPSTTEAGWDKMEWEHEFRLEEKRCRYYDCMLYFFCFFFEDFGTFSTTT